MVYSQGRLLGSASCIEHLLLLAQTIDGQDNAIADLQSQLQRARGDLAAHESQLAAAAADSAALRGRLTDLTRVTDQQLMQVIMAKTSVPRMTRPQTCYVLLPASQTWQTTLLHLAVVTRNIQA